MGLRERNAELTRELILDSALALFLEQGYDAATMEGVAAAAGIGTSTLYRYFSSKDELVVEPLAIRDQMAEALRSRPADEPVAEALGHALRELVVAERAHGERLTRIRAIVEANAGPRARLAEDLARARRHLAVALAERLGRGPDDLACAMTARVTVAVLEELGEHDDRDVPADPTARAEHLTRALGDVLARLSAEPPVLPVLAVLPDPPDLRTPRSPAHPERKSR